jgi:hypothetical protein
MESMHSSRLSRRTVLLLRFFLLVSLSLILGTGSVRASGGGFGVGNIDGWYLPFGMNIGYAIHPAASNGLALGGEISLVQIHEARGLNFGFYADYIHDSGTSTHWISVGPEILINMLIGNGDVDFPIDAGPTFELAHGKTHYGARCRIFGPAFFVMPYFGTVFTFDDASDRWLLEAGVLVKFPVPLQ